MKNLRDATERICELKGSLVALDALVPAVIEALSAPARARLTASFDAQAEAARTVLLHADISDVVLATFERDVARNRTLLLASVEPDPPAASPARVDIPLLATTCVATLAGARVLARASGFFFRRSDRLFLVSDRHVFADAASGHRPDRIEFGVHVDPRDLARHALVSLPLYREGLRQWREGGDDGHAADVAAMEIPPGSLPAGAAPQAFDETHLELRGEQVAIGDALSIAGFSPAFHDSVHHLAIARSATVASAYGVRYRGRACFLTDAHGGHRGDSGSPIVRRRLGDGASVPSWQLIGVHSPLLRPDTRDLAPDDSAGLGCAWYADVLPALTAAA